jgi:hypothetical protein
MSHFDDSAEVLAEMQHALTGGPAPAVAPLAAGDPRAAPPGPPPAREAPVTATDEIDGDQLAVALARGHAAIADRAAADPRFYVLAVRVVGLRRGLYRAEMHGGFASVAAPDDRVLAALTPARPQLAAAPATVIAVADLDGVDPRAYRTMVVRSAVALQSMLWQCLGEGIEGIVHAAVDPIAFRRLAAPDAPTVQAIAALSIGI